jgi:hypothetical protein
MPAQKDENDATKERTEQCTAYSGCFVGLVTTSVVIACYRLSDHMDTSTSLGTIDY